jgi:nucleoside-diphosphate-sugar epimerase
VSVNHVLEIVGRVADRPPILTVDSAQKGDMRHTYANTDLARADLAFEPTVTLEQGLAAEYAWLKQSLDTL